MCIFRLNWPSVSGQLVFKNCQYNLTILQICVSPLSEYRTPLEQNYALGQI